MYFKHKQKCRLDILINTLLKIARDIAFESLIKKDKWKLTNRVCNINKPHTANKGLLIKGSITTRMQMERSFTEKLKYYVHSSKYTSYVIAVATSFEVV